jgi:hypothetical protein
MECIEPNVKDDTLSNGQDGQHLRDCNRRFFQQTIKYKLFVSGSVKVEGDLDGLPKKKLRNWIGTQDKENAGKKRLNEGSFQSS